MTPGMTWRSFDYELSPSPLPPSRGAVLSNKRNVATIHGGSALNLVGGDSDTGDDSDDSAGLSPDAGARGWADHR